ncbi:hypothetical protein D3C80_1876420 [compost metagenome]
MLSHILWEVKILIYATGRKIRAIGVGADKHDLVITWLNGLKLTFNVTNRFCAHELISTAMYITTNHFVI